MNKIIDFERKGNLVRFYLGREDCEDYWGDDWNDRPYEHNAGPVYDSFITGHIDICFPMNHLVLEASEDYSYCGNSPWSKEDMINRHTPCIASLNMDRLQGGSGYWQYEGYFEHVIANADSYRFYFGMAMDPWILKMEYPDLILVEYKEDNKETEK